MTGDVSQYARLRPAQERIAQALRAAQDRRWSAVYACCRDLQARVCPSCGVAHVMPLASCKHRLCPTCQWRRSRRLAAQALAVYTRAGARLTGCRMALLTLTQRNVIGEDLPGELTALLAAFARLRGLRDVRRGLVGYARNVEITYNPVSRTYHPHVHVIAWLGPDALPALDQSTWWALAWQKCMRLDYVPVCDMRPINDVEGAVCEVTKYICKAGELSTLAPRTLARVCHAINTACGSRRLIAYGGLWATVRAELALTDDVDSDEADGLQDTVCGCGAALVDAVLRWNGNEYIQRPK